MGNLQFVGDAASVLDILPGAAGALTPRCLAMVVELKRDADDIVALRLYQRRNDRGIDPAGHGDDHAGPGLGAIKETTVEHWRLQRNHYKYPLETTSNAGRPSLRSSGNESFRSSGSIVGRLQTHVAFSCPQGANIGRERPIGKTSGISGISGPA